MTGRPGPRVEPVADADDPRLADYRALSDRDRRRAASTFLAESSLVVRRLLAGSRFRVRSLLLTPSALDGLRDALDGASEAFDVYVAGPDVLGHVLGLNFHRGCLAVAERGPALAVDALTAPPGPRTLLVLGQIADPRNVGSLFRNARALGSAALLLSPGCGDPLYPKAIRASMGAALTLPFARFAAWPSGLEQLRRAGYTLIALAPTGNVDLADFGRRRPAPSRAALLVGNEGEGLDDAALALADVTVRIAMAPGADSLNVAVAAGVALHHLYHHAPHP